jgi:tetratricopeptide (TPR) repeat protein
MRAMHRIKPWQSCGLVLTVVLAVAGCAGRGQVVVAPTPNTPTATPPPAAANSNPALIEYEARQRETADSATQRGRWAEAILALDVLQALRPTDASLVQRRAQAEESAKLVASERLRQAKAAQQRGDSEAATRLFLEVLALQPAPAMQLEAAEALRALERERVARQHLGVAARLAFARSPLQEKLNAKPASAGRNDVEHASMMAAQGDVSGAIALLKPVNAEANADPSARRLLADLYLRQAEGLWPQQRDAAINAAERGLKVDPKHKLLRERLALWRGAAAAPSAAIAASAPSAAASAAKAAKSTPSPLAPAAATKTLR